MKNLTEQEKYIELVIKGAIFYDSIHSLAFSSIGNYKSCTISRAMLLYNLLHNIRIDTKLKFKNQIILPAFVIMICFCMLLSNYDFSIKNAYSQRKIINGTSLSATSSFQSKASILDNMPSQNVTVGDIDIAYKQIGKPNAKPIILITGADATMDMWNPLLLEQLTAA